ncbi:MAG: hypothetical protein LBT05_07080 [Planctomycetaceae bacterium]|nr:hypothetical protein [Planctomycetaceae bacterium]
MDGTTIAATFLPSLSDYKMPTSSERLMIVRKRQARKHFSRKMFYNE